MGCTYRQLTDYDAVHAGIDLWDRVHWTEFVDYYGTLGFEPWITYDTFTKEVSQ
jgi:hypothetical protein